MKFYGAKVYKISKSFASLKKRSEYHTVTYNTIMMFEDPAAG
jgi:hypothetical protein